MIKNLTAFLEKRQEKLVLIKSPYIEIDGKLHGQCAVCKKTSLAGGTLLEHWKLDIDGSEPLLTCDKCKDTVPLEKLKGENA